MKFLVFQDNEKFYNLLKSGLEDIGLEIEKVELKLPLFSYDVKKFARESAKFSANKLDESVVFLVDSFEISSLNNFPGFLKDFVLNTIGYRSLTKLIPITDKKCVHKAVIAYAEPSNKVVIFEKLIEGKLKLLKDYKNFYSAFCPDNEQESYENEEINSKYNPIFKVIKAFLEYVNKKVNGFKVELERIKTIIFAPKEGYVRLNLKYTRFPDFTITITIDKPEYMLQRLIQASKKHLQKEISMQEEFLREDEVIVNLLEEESEEFDKVFLWLKSLYSYAKEMRRSRKPEEYMEIYNEIEENLTLELKQFDKENKDKEDNKEK